jgi:glycosyltransferase involved in cell wall biosynthesis
VRIAIDATPAAIQRGGVGRYARELLRALMVEAPDQRFVLATAAGEEAVRRLLAALPPGAWREARRLPASERVMTAFWQRLHAPLSIERWIGPVDIYHGTDFTLPPVKAPAVVTIHDLSFLLTPEHAEPRLARYLQGAVPRAIERASAVVTVSSSVAAQVAAHYPQALGKLVAIPNGVQVPDCSPPRKESEQPRVFTVGTIEPRKNHLTLLAAMAQVRDVYPDALLVVAGRAGWQAAEIVAALESGEAHGRLRWLRNLGDRQLEDEYAAATLCVFPSHYEGFGLPLLEAMARGVPVLASDIAAHRDVAGDAAVYAAPNDQDEWARRIVELLGDEARRARMAAAGKERVRGFTWNETARRTLRVYRAVAVGGVA